MPRYNETVARRHARNQAEDPDHWSMRSHISDFTWQIQPAGFESSQSQKELNGFAHIQAREAYRWSMPLVAYHLVVASATVLKLCDVQNVLSKLEVPNCTLLFFVCCNL